MTIQTAHPGHHISGKSVALALAGTALAAATGYGIATVVLDEEVAPTIFNQGEATGSGGGGSYEPDQFPGTNREERSLMHRR